MTQTIDQDLVGAVDARWLPVVLRLSPLVSLSDEQLFELCQLNEQLWIERTAEGDLEIMPPSGAESGSHNFSVTGPLWVWSEADGTGIGFDSSPGFTLPNSAMRSPDAAWIKRERW